MKLIKSLILLVFFTGVAAIADDRDNIHMHIWTESEKIKKPYEIDNVLVTFFWFDTLSDLREHFGEERLKGYSKIETYEEKGICHADVYVVRPQVVDGEHTLTIGHEVLHCVYGEGYHEVVE